MFLANPNINLVDSGTVQLTLKKSNENRNKIHSTQYGFLFYLLTEIKFEIFEK